MYEGQVSTDRLAATHLHAELMSVPSASFCQMPMTWKPKEQVQVSHRVSRWFWRT